MKLSKENTFLFIILLLIIPLLCIVLSASLYPKDPTPYPMLAGFILDCIIILILGLSVLISKLVKYLLNGDSNNA